MSGHLFERASLSKLRFNSNNKPRPMRIMIVGQRGVGKTALVVRFITSRFIGDYDSSTDKVYKYSTFVDNEMMTFEIIDSPGVRNPGAPDDNDNPSSASPPSGAAAAAAAASAHGSGGGSPDPAAMTPDADLSALEKHIQNADAFIIMYSVTDQCSFDDCNRLRFLINYNNKQRRRSITKDCALDIPVMLVGNKKDQRDDRMVDVQQGKRMYREMSCAGFHEISVRESADEVWNVFRDLCRCWRIFTHYPKLKRSTSDAQTISYMLLSPDIAANGAGAGAGAGAGGANGSAAATGGSGGGYFDGWLRGGGGGGGGEKRPSFFVFRSNGANGGGGGSSSSSTQQSPSVEDVNTNATAGTGGTKKLSVRLSSYQQQQQQQQLQQPFRERASTDGKILSRPRKWQYLSATSQTVQTTAASGAAVLSSSASLSPHRGERRMSISQRGSSGN